MQVTEFAALFSPIDSFLDIGLVLSISRGQSSIPILANSSRPPARAQDLVLGFSYSLRAYDLEHHYTMTGNRRCGIRVSG